MAKDAVQRSLQVALGGLLTFTGGLLTAQAAYGLTAPDNDVIFPTNNAPGPCEKGGVCQTDNNYLTYYMDNTGTNQLEEDDRDGVRHVLNNQYDPTDLSVHYDSSPSFSGGAETDIIYIETYVDGNNDGVTSCNDPVNNVACDQMYVQIEPQFYHTNEGLVCHETGHAVGLVHGPQASPPRDIYNSYGIMGCMVKPNGASDVLSQTDINNIDYVYN